jgi:hypothetical protein
MKRVVMPGGDVVAHGGADRLAGFATLEQLEDQRAQPDLFGRIGDTA